MRLYAIGDVHGRLDLLSAMHRHIAAELDEAVARQGAADWRVVHLGDHVDRGPDSKGVLDFLIAARERDPRNLLLAGNHDVGFLDFIDHPDPDGLFLRFGGMQTALSYGVDLGAGASFRDSHAALIAAVPAAHIAFLRAPVFAATFGDFFFCHAGIRPGIALDRQVREDLIWIRDEFHRHTGLYAKVVVHGHTPKPEAEIRPNRVNIDTLAYQSGRLTALAVDGAVKRILTATADGVVQRSAAVTP